MDGTLGYLYTSKSSLSLIVLMTNEHYIESVDDWDLLTPKQLYSNHKEK